MGIIFLSLAIFILLFLSILGYSYLEDDEFDIKSIEISFLKSGVISLIIFLLLILVSLFDGSSITNYNYFQALGAKTYLENQTNYNMDNHNLIEYSFDSIEKYQTLRNRINKNKDRYLDGIYYSPETLDEFPEVTLDSLTISKFK